ncbi:MAG TPA: hypothetical protein PLH57_08175 [Oligoflexia bacterium]|jgi:hypothetical protein|nr:hypothetical protein [Oligoflexia bacterium]
MTLKSDLHHRIWERAVEAALWPMLSDAPLISLKEHPRGPDGEHPAT